MCGICGFVTNKSVEVNMLKQMNELCKHRGHDDGTLYFEDKDKKIGLAYKKLSISDLAQPETQPMINEDMDVVVVFSGEIYNYNKVKSDLKSYGFKFKSNCHTEIIIYAYKQWGIECLKRFNGVFAIALYDKAQEKLFLARDRLGEKPLYYYIKDGDFVFDSDLKSIMHFKYFKKELNQQSVYKYFIYSYIPTPNTIFKYTYKLYPGSYLEYKNGDIEIKKYWGIPNNYEQFKDYNENEILQGIERLLYDSIRLRMISDVPIGALLTGGIDSSLMTAIMSSMSSTPIKTFTIGCKDLQYNEALLAKEISKCLGTDHTELYIDSKNIIDVIPSLVDYYDEPFADISALPTLMISKLARQSVKVSLSGDGGDELFCGYSRYKSADNIKDIYRINTKIRKFSLEVIGKILNKKDNIKKYMYHDLCEFYRSCISIYDKDLVKQLLISNENIFKFELYDKTFKSNFKGIDNFLDTIMITDIKTYLLDDILTKLDRTGMGSSLESRVPFLDYRLVEYSQRIPIAMKYKNKELKYILKTLLQGYIPKELFGSSNNGFIVPMNDWLRNDLKELLLTYVNNKGLEQQGIMDKNEVERLAIEHMNNIKDNSRILWAILFFEMWYEKYIE